MLNGNAKQYTSQDIVEILSPDYPKSIPGKLAIALSTLTELNLIAYNIGDNGAKHIADALKCNTTLQNLYLGSNNIGNNGAKHIADALKDNTTLQTLGLDMNNIGDNGAKHIADALKDNTTLHTLYLSFNKIGANGAKHIAGALNINTTLQTLSLGHNKIGANGAGHIVGALKYNTTLQELDLAGSEIGDNGAGHIADALKCNTTLQNFYLSFNKIGNNGAEHIADALKCNTTLQNLNLGSNKIEKDGARELYNAIQFYNIAIVALIPSVFDRERRGNFILQNQNVHKFIKDIKKDHFSDGKSQYKDLIPELKTRSSFAEYHLHFLYHHCVCNTKKNGFDNTPLNVLPNEILLYIFEMCDPTFFDAKYTQQPAVCRRILGTVMRELKNDLVKKV